MKNFILTFVCLFIGLMSFSQDIVWDINEWDLSSGYATETVVNGITIIPGSGVSNAGAVDTGNHTFPDGYQGSKRLKTNGSSYNNTTDWANPNRRYFTFPVTGACTVKVWYRNGGGGNRVFYIIANNEVIATNSVTDDTNGKILEGEYSGSEPTIVKLASGVNAHNIHKIEVTYNSTSNSPTISAASCNSTINLFHYDLINADEFPNATNYRFKIGTSTFDSATGSATLANILGSGITFGTNYQVSVAAFVGDEWTDFGDECQISTTAAPLTEIQFIACGSTLPNIATNVYFKNGYGVQMYEYQLTRVSDNVVLGTHQTTNRFVKLTDFTGVMYNTEYNLQARMMHNDVWGGYSAACSIFTPNNVTTQLRPVYCGMNLANNFSPIYARGVIGASQYEFRVVNTSTSEMGTVVRNTSAFHLGQVQGITVSAATTYNVEVRVNINDSWGPYGTICTVTTPGIPALLNNASINAINDIVAYPNPFNNQFSVKLASSDMANIQLFDINGRLIEMQNVQDAFEVEMGQNANAGVYILKVTQNGETQSFKMIKK